MFCDLNRALCEGRMLYEVAIVGLGGFPVIEDDEGRPTIFGQVVTAELARDEFLRGLGLGAVLTFWNPKKRTLDEMGHMCLGLGHLWTYHALSMTLLFSGADLAVRDAFAFDGRFHLSWVAREVGTKKVTFTAAGSLKQWRRMLKKKDDESFELVQRQWFAKADELVSKVMP